MIGSGLSLSAQSQPNAGLFTVTDITGDVSWVDPTTGASAPIVLNETLPVGATIVTAADSSASIAFSTGSTVLVEADSAVKIASFTQAPFDPADLINDTIEPSVSHLELFVEKGGITNDVRSLRPGSVYTVNSPDGAVSVKGTVFFFQIDVATGNLILKVNEGLVVFIGTDGQYAEIPEGTKMEDAKNMQRQPMSTAERVEFRNALVRLSTARDAVTSNEGTIYTKSVEIATASDDSANTNVAGNTEDEGSSNDDSNDDDAGDDNNDVEPSTEVVIEIPTDNIVVSPST
ncbi:FecR family protein [Actomonas aquatica]|uniref:FecR domain-containing protein n=1 Tax=Actomonas aquatica TaxID=2866162 RepID=A0ABZ1C2I0_9BACT|nr:FecR domain-containing protein [Opitutus sp. WL0086]WRQ85916.1 FecR domain-containing protein [Opitutus sp. WL0086]